MRRFQVLFVLLLLLCGVVVFASTLTEVPTQRGLVHPDFPTMQLGGDSEARHGGILWLGWLYGALMLAFFVGLVDSSLCRGNRPPPPVARKILWTFGAAVQLIFLALILSYRSFMADPLQSFVLGFPRPSAWMMYAIWGAPVVLVCLYIFKFDTWVLGPEDERRFAELVAERGAGDDH